MPLIEVLHHCFRHVWSDISLASWKKYPSPERPDLLSADILSRELDPATGVLKTKKLIIARGSGPVWLQKLLNNEICYFVEESTVDPRNQIMTLTSHNISFSNIVLLQETCTYTPDRENANWTHFRQEANITAFPFGISGRVESFLADVFKKNAQKGREIMEQAIARVQTERELAAQGIINFAEESLTKVADLTNSLTADNTAPISHT